MEKILENIKNILVSKLDTNLKMEQIEDNASLLEDGLCLDSIAIINLLVNLESHFKIEFQDSEINLDLFRDLTKLSLFIKGKLN